MIKLLCNSLLVLISLELNANPYESSHWMGDFEIKYSSEVFRTDPQNLIPAAKLLHKAATEIYLGDPTENLEVNYLAAFPRDFKTFLDVFHRLKNRQLNDGHIYMHILSKMSKKYPEEVGGILFSLSSEACLDADAPNYLRHELEEFNKNYSNLYASFYEKLNWVQKDNIKLFLNASLHDMGDGTCTF